MLENYYAIMGFDTIHDLSDISKRYEYLIKKYRSEIYDERELEEKLAQLERAYKVLGTHESKKEYDKEYIKHLLSRADDIIEYCNEFLKKREELVLKVMRGELDEETYIKEADNLEESIREPEYELYRMRYILSYISYDDPVKWEKISKIESFLPPTAKIDLHLPSYEEISREGMYFEYSKMLREALRQAGGEYHYGTALLELLALKDTKDWYEIEKKVESDDIDETLFVEKVKIIIQKDDITRNIFIKNPKLDIKESKKIKAIENKEIHKFLVENIEFEAGLIALSAILTSSLFYLFKDPNNFLCNSVGTFLVVPTIGVDVLSIMLFPILPGYIKDLIEQLRNKKIKKYISNEQLNDYIPLVIEAFLQEIGEKIESCKTEEEVMELKRIFEPIIEKSNAILSTNESVKQIVKTKTR